MQRIHCDACPATAEAEMTARWSSIQWGGFTDKIAGPGSQDSMKPRLLHLCPDCSKEFELRHQPRMWRRPDLWPDVMGYDLRSPARRRDEDAGKLNGSGVLIETITASVAQAIAQAFEKHRGESA